jgi:hypothetical protein
MMEWLKEKMTADRDGLSIKTSKDSLRLSCDDNGKDSVQICKYG